MAIKKTILTVLFMQSGQEKKMLEELGFKADHPLMKAVVEYDHQIHQAFTETEEWE